MYSEIINKFDIKKIAPELLILIALVEGSLIYLLWPTDKNFEHLVDLPSYHFSNGFNNDGEYYYEPTDNLVSAGGTWTSDTQLTSTVQTTEIECWRRNGNKSLCIESTAQIMDGLLSVNTKYHEIATWTQNEITTKPLDSEFGCAQYTMSLDRVQKKVSSVRTAIKNTDGCEKIDPTPIYLYLTDGFDIWKKSNEPKR